MPRLKLCSIVAPALLFATVAQAQENILVIVADTVGPGLIGACVFPSP